MGLLSTRQKNTFKKCFKNASVILKIPYKLISVVTRTWIWNSNMKWVRFCYRHHLARRQCHQFWRRFENILCQNLSFVLFFSRKEWEELFLNSNYLARIRQKGLTGQLRSSRYRSVCWKVRRTVKGKCFTVLWDVCVVTETTLPWCDSFLYCLSAQPNMTCLRKYIAGCLCNVVAV